MGVGEWRGGGGGSSQCVRSIVNVSLPIQNGEGRGGAYFFAYVLSG